MYPFTKKLVWVYIASALIHFVSDWVIERMLLKSFLSMRIDTKLLAFIIIITFITSTDVDGQCRRRRPTCCRQRRFPRPIYPQSPMIKQVIFPPIIFPPISFPPISFPPMSPMPPAGPWWCSILLQFVLVVTSCYVSINSRLIS